jgi:hypothetical protein
MACCVGKPSHEAGSCSVAFASEIEKKASDEHDGHSAHSATKHHQAHNASTDKESSQTASVAALAMRTPCSPECAAVASASTQLRRQRESAALTVSSKPRPPTAFIFKKDFSKDLLPSIERERCCSPRAPPSSLDNLSA